MLDTLCTYPLALHHHHTHFPPRSIAKKHLAKMLPSLALLPLLPHLALAAPTTDPIPAHASELSPQHRAGLVLRTLDAIERETRSGRTINFDAVLSPAERDFLGLGGGNAALRERQLIGGGDDYAPYEMPCPDNYDWVRSADVRCDLYGVGTALRVHGGKHDMILESG